MLCGKRQVVLIVIMTAPLFNSLTSRDCGNGLQKCVCVVWRRALSEFVELGRTLIKQEAVRENLSSLTAQ
jgi:hypothetical protein